MEPTKVLWVGRKGPIREEKEALRNIFGRIYIFKYMDYIDDIKEFIDLAYEMGFRVAVVFLSFELLKELMSHIKDKKYNMTILVVSLSPVKKLDHKPVKHEDYDPDIEVWTVKNGVYIVQRFMGYKIVDDEMLEKIDKLRINKPFVGVLEGESE